jgi:hypothetical protein
MSPAVDVITDVICPWCYIGKRRLEKAVAALGGPVRVRWLPFQLNPTMPKEGVSRRGYRTKKFGSWERLPTAGNCPATCPQGQDRRPPCRTANRLREVLPVPRNGTVLRRRCPGTGRPGLVDHAPARAC